MPPRTAGSPRAPGSRPAGEAAVVAALAESFGIAVARMLPIEGGWDADAAVWQAVDAEGRSWSAKATRRDVAFGLEVAAALAEAGVEGIIAPVRARDGALWAEADGARVIVAPWIDGIDAVEVGVDRVDWRRLGRTLRAVHDQPPPTAAVPRRRGVRRAGTAPADLVADADTRVRDRGDATLDARWQAARRRLVPLVRAERALKRGRAPALRVTLHGDPHLGNVVLDADGRPWFIDFDESAIAPREVDLMLVELGVLFSLPIAERHRRAFREGYGEDAAVDPLRIVRFGCVRAVEDAVSAVRHALDGTGPSGVDPLASLDGMLGEHGLVSLVEAELARLHLLDDAPAAGA